MKRLVISIALFLTAISSQAQSYPTCQNLPTMLKKICTRWHQIWHEGQNDYYFTGYAWHNRYTYDISHLKNYNEKSLGGGLGRSFYDEDLDWHGLYSMAFLDSHRNVEPVVGYAFLKMMHKAHFHLGAGYGILFTARPDICHGYPFPGILPWASIGFRNLSMGATYIPGGKGSGNVLFLFAKWNFNEEV